MKTYDQYNQIKQKLTELYPTRNNSPENRIEFDDLLHEIVEFEIKEGIINENDIK